MAVLYDSSEIYSLNGLTNKIVDFEPLSVGGRCDLNRQYTSSLILRLADRYNCDNVLGRPSRSFGYVVQVTYNGAVVQFQGPGASAKRDETSSSRPVLTSFT